MDDEAVPTLSADNSKFQFDFKFGFLLPWTFRFLGLLAVIGSFPLMTKNIWLGVPLLGVGLLTVLTYEGAEINHKEKVYREYTSFLIFKTGNFISYDAIEKLYINQKRETQRMYSAHTAKSADFTDEVFDAYLKFSSGVKILLLSKRNKEKLLNQLKKFSASIDVPIVDNT